MFAGPACGFGGEGAAAAGGGEGEGGVAAEGSGPQYCSAGEGPVDPEPPTGTGALPGNVSDIRIEKSETDAVFHMSSRETLCMRRCFKNVELDWMSAQAVKTNGFAETHNFPS